MVVEENGCTLSYNAVSIGGYFTIGEKPKKRFEPVSIGSQVAEIIRVDLADMLRGKLLELKRQQESLEI